MGTRSDSLRVLFTCVGRRVELIEAFRRAARELKIDLTVHGADMTRLAPAMHRVDKAHIVPGVSDPKLIPTLRTLVRRHQLDLVIPLLDLELLQLSRVRDEFERVGCRVIVSSEAVIQACRDKLQTFQLLKSAGIDTPETWTREEALAKKRHRFPYYLKPREGSAGMGNYKINDLAELKVLSARVRDPIVQEFVEGVEHTLDVYTGFDGVPRCVVPRRRLEVRNGEVAKAVTVKDRRIMAIGREVATALGECRGVITVQCIVTPQGRIRVIEINPRFGGGAPLGVAAGANYPLWLMAEHLGREVNIRPTGFKNYLAMLRFDDSVFVAAGKQLRMSNSE